MRSGCMTFVMEGFGLSWCLIIVLNGSSALLRNLILTMKPGRLSPLPLGLIVPSNVSTMRKMKWSWSGINVMTDIRAAHRGGHSFDFGQALVEHDSIKTQINRARERRVMKQMAEKYGPIVYKKGI